jgi:hypothetical protein
MVFTTEYTEEKEGFENESFLISPQTTGELETFSISFHRINIFTTEYTEEKEGFERCEFLNFTTEPAEKRKL